jgi:hypothetical protein
MSSTCALCVSQPTDSRSTPDAAIAGAVSGRMRPEASVVAGFASVMRESLHLPSFGPS